MMEIHKLPLVAMRRGLREKRFSARELVRAHLEEIERREGEINAFVRLYAEEALAGAQAADQRLRDPEQARPLEGIPVTIKDSFDIAGEPTLCGSRLRLAHRAAEDAFVVARLKRAGAIVLGKTNCPEFLMNYETDNYVKGRTNHPRDATRTAGGSSGGEAAAIAAYCSAGGMGSDGGGSIREPAHFCGIAGLKPTPGRVPAAGHVPPICHPGGLLGVAGPMARTVADVETLLEVVAGCHPADPFSVPMAPAPAMPAWLRVGVAEQFFEIPAQAPVRAAVRKAARLLAERGMAVEEGIPEALRGAEDLWWFFFGRLNAILIAEAIAGKEDQTHWTGVELMRQAQQEPEPTAGQMLRRLAERDEMRARVLVAMEKTPVLLLPACGVTAFRHRERRFAAGAREITLREAMAPLVPFNLLGFPALTVPVEMSGEGLPVGVQLVGRPWEEHLLLEVGKQLEQAAAFAG